MTDPTPADRLRRLSQGLVTAAYRRITRSVFQPRSAITIGAVKPALTTAG